MGKKQPAIQKHIPRACTRSSLYTPRNDLKISLKKCPKESKLKSSSFDILIG